MFESVSRHRRVLCAISCTPVFVDLSCAQCLCVFPFSHGNPQAEKHILQIGSEVMCLAHSLYQWNSWVCIPWLLDRWVGPFPGSFFLRSQGSHRSRGAVESRLGYCCPLLLCAPTFVWFVFRFSTKAMLPLLIVCVCVYTIVCLYGGQRKTYAF